MLFNSIQFLIFFPVTILIYFLLPKKCKNLWLLFASYIFYMGWNVKYSLLLIFSTAVSFFASLIIESQRHKKAKTVLIIAIIIIFSLIFYFKYLNFVISLINPSVPKFDIILHFSSSRVHD